MIPYNLFQSSIVKESNNMQDCTLVENVNERTKVIGIETYFGDISHLPETAYSCADIYLMMMSNEKMQNEDRFIFYSHVNGENDSILLISDGLGGLPWTSEIAFVHFDRIPADVDKIVVFLRIFDNKTVPKKLRHNFSDYECIRYRAFISDINEKLNDDVNSTIIQREVLISTGESNILEIGYLQKNGDMWNYVVAENAVDIDLIEYIKRCSNFKIE